MSPNSCYNLFWKVYIPASDLNFTKKKKNPSQEPIVHAIVVKLVSK